MPARPGGLWGLQVSAKVPGVSQTAITLAPTSVESNAGSNTVGAHTCRPQSYATLPPARVGGKKQ
eukprot:scaffold83247_cov21-Phaeocystis_antarctica.AAC.1